MVTAEPIPPPDAYQEAARFLRTRPAGGHLRLVARDGSSVELPDELTDVLDRAAGALVAGHPVTVVQTDRLISTTQAARILGVSRPTLVRFLEAGEIAYAQPGRHRRLKLADVLAFRERRHRRRDVLDDMAADAAELGLYDIPEQEYAEAAEQVRAERRGDGNRRS